MNSIWNNNISLFKKRFPDFFTLINDNIKYFEKYIDTPEEKSKLYPTWTVTKTINNEYTLEENKLRLHSKYNPVKESLSIIERNKNTNLAIFLGFGLGYTCIEYAKKNQNNSIIIVEPDINRFLSALLFLNWKDIFLHQDLILAINCTPEQVITLINQKDVLSSFTFLVKAQIEHNLSYFETVNELIKRNIDKTKINNATLEKFRKRWIKNSCKNLEKSINLNGINSFFNQNNNLPFLILAAGPSLQNVLPYLKELKKRTIIICVDTALRFCIKHNVEVDFIIITDPQFYAYKHIQGLKSKSSILITEAAVYPSVFNFDCKEIICYKSTIPIESTVEDFLSLNKGQISSGGSVASAAWFFAKLTGATEMFCAGLDLSYPNKQTHIKGSTFENLTHASSKKIKPAETSNMPILYSANTFYEKNYNEQNILTDQRMKLFAWWFESNIEKYPQIKNYTLSKDGLKIPGFSFYSIEELLKRKEITKEKELFLFNSLKQKKIITKEEFLKAKNKIKQELQNIINFIKDLPKNKNNSNVIQNYMQNSFLKELLQILLPTNNEIQKFQKSQEELIIENIQFFLKNF